MGRITNDCSCSLRDGGGGGGGGGGQGCSNTGRRVVKHIFPVV